MIRPRRGERREDRRARADDDVHFAAPDAVPLVVAFAVGEPAVLDRHARAEARAEHRRDRGRQRDLRHQHQHAAARRAHRLGQAQIDLGLAAAGDAMQQRDAERAGSASVAQSLDGVAAVRSVSGVRAYRGADGAALAERERIALLALLPDGDQPHRLEPRDDGGRDAARASSGARQAVRRAAAAAASRCRVQR